MRLNEVRLEPDDFAEGRDGFVEVFVLLKRQPHRVARLYHLGRESDRSL